MKRHDLDVHVIPTVVRLFVLDAAYRGNERADRSTAGRVRVPNLRLPTDRDPVGRHCPRGLDLADGCDIAVMEIDGFTHPLSAVYRRTTLPFVEDLLAGNRLRPAFLFEAVKTRRIHPEQMTADPDLRTLRNLNTREDYEQALTDAGF